jgi:hypothetical protein
LCQEAENRREESCYQLSTISAISFIYDSKNARAIAMSDKNDAQGKVEIKIGDMSFSAEGNQEWLDRQVTKLLEAAASSSIGHVPAAAAAGAETQTKKLTPVGSLVSYLKAKGGDSKQVVRFLATAAWLSRRGQENLSASTIAKALSDNHQKRLANPADCLNKNVSKGFCEKTKGGFFITPEGWAELGEKQ